MIKILNILLLFFWTINSYADSVDLRLDYANEFPTLNQKIISEANESIVIKAYSPNNLYNVLDHKQVSDICSQLTSDHLQDIKFLNELYLSLQELFKTDEWLLNSKKRIDIQNQIKDLSSKIIKAANPDWNQESISYTVNWHLPRNLFFPIDNYIQAKKRLNDGHYSSRQQRNSDLSSLLNKHDYVKSIQIEQAQFLNEPNNNISRYLYLLVGMNNPDEIVISYSKMATVLEVCQFMPKTKFLIRVDYSFDFGIKVNSSKKIFLEIE